MSDVYSGLRRRRKRTHPSKCPCCITDHEIEPENEASAGSENHNEEIRNIRQSKRKRTIIKKEDEIKSDSESSELNSNEANTETPSSKKRKLRNSCDSQVSQNSSPKQDTTKKVSKVVSLKKKDQNNKEKSNGERTLAKSKAKNGSSKNGGDTSTAKKDLRITKKNSKTLLHNSDEEDKNEGGEDTLTSKPSRSKRSSSAENNIKRKNPDKNVSGKAKGTTKTRLNNNETKKEIVKIDEVTSQDSVDQTFKTAKKSKSKKSVSKTLLKGKTSKRTPIEKSSLAVTKPTQSKAKGTVVHVSKVTQTKIMVFDSLYHKLKIGPGNKDVSIEEAAEILMKISSESLQLAVAYSQRVDNSDKQYSQASRHGKKGISDTEEIVSQAAEALVSFRSKSPLSREDSQIDKTAASSQGFHSTGSAPLITGQTEVQAKPATAATYASSQAVQALMQIQTSHTLPTQVFSTTPVTAPLPQNILQGLLPTGTMSQSYPQLLPSTISTSFPNLMPIVSSHGTLPSFSQIAAQLRPPPMSGSVQSPLLNSGLPSPSVMLPNQALLQPQLQQPTPMSNAVSGQPNLTNLTNAQEPAGSKTTTQPQNPLQQPLKGMEEVIGNVGSNVPPPIVWNIKSPVVFLGSPQNLGGVPRNLMASPSSSQSCTNSDHLGYPPVAPRPASKSDILRMNPGPVSSVPNVLTLGGRPILPRTQMQSGDDGKRLQSIAPQSGMPLASQHPALSPSSPYLATSSTLPGQAALTQVTSINTKRTTLMSVNVPPSPSQVGLSLSNFMHHQNIQESPATDCLSPSSVSAKQAVKKLVHERTKSAELKREANSLPTSKLKAILPLPPKEPTTVSTATSASIPESATKNYEFNLEQAATTLLSIGVPEGIESIGLKQSPFNACKEDREEDVVFTSKGTFRVGDVDVDPRFNRIGREGYTCGKCNKIFTSLSYLARHIKRVCPDMSCRKWKCTLCDKAFRHPFGLQQHVYTHTGERPHKCPLCPKAFYSSNDLRRHSRIHSGERPYRCKHCDKSFATTISLKTHTYIHTGEKPHKCPQCPKTFATSSKLGRHIVTHSEQRPFSCDQCPKSFNRSGDLRRHNLAVHDGKEKSFDCDLCTSTFSKAADLRRHSTTLHQRPLKTMECEDCGTQFSTPICLKMHRDTYHKNPSMATTADTDKVYTCDVCGKRYSSAVLLTKHKTTHEPSSTTGYNPTHFQHIAPKPMEQAANESGTV